MISSTACLALIALALRFAWPHLRRRVVTDATYAVFIMLAVLSSEFTWEHYWLIFVLPMAILIAALVEVLRGESSTRARVSACAGLLITAGIAWQWRRQIVSNLTFQTRYLAGDHSAHFQLHFTEVLNWLPNLALLACLMALTAMTSRKLVPHEEAAPASARMRPASVAADES